MATQKAPEIGRKAADAASWKKAKIHEAVLPSGLSIELQIPNLPLLVKTGQVPNDLIESAIGAMQGDVQITADLLTDQAEFYNKLVALTVITPSISETDVPELPYEDVEMIVEFATRQRDVDALGRHIAGLHKSKEWRSFRGLDYGGSSMASL